MLPAAELHQILRSHVFGAVTAPLYERLAGCDCGSGVIVEDEQEQSATQFAAIAAIRSTLTSAPVPVDLTLRRHYRDCDCDCDCERFGIRATATVLGEDISREYGVGEGA